MEYNKIDICGITETHMKNNNERKEIKSNKNKIQQSITKETDFHRFFEDQYIVITKNRKKQKGRRGHGGIGIVVRKNIGTVKELKEKSNDGILWIEINCGGRMLYIATVYMVPIGSPFYEQNSQIRQELEKDISEYKKHGIVIVTGDFNSRIGNLFSITSENKLYHRENIDTQQNHNGRELIKLIQK